MPFCIYNCDKYIIAPYATDAIFRGVSRAVSLKTAFEIMGYFCSADVTLVSRLIMPLAFIMATATSLSGTQWWYQQSTHAQKRRQGNMVFCYKVLDALLRGVSRADAVVKLLWLVLATDFLAMAGAVGCLVLLATSWSSYHRTIKGSQDMEIKLAACAQNKRISRVIDAFFRAISRAKSFMSLLEAIGQLLGVSLNFIAQFSLLPVFMVTALTSFSGTKWWIDDISVLQSYIHTNGAASSQKIADSFFRGIARTDAVITSLNLIELPGNLLLLIGSGLLGAITLVATTWSSYCRNQARVLYAKSLTEPPLLAPV